MAQSDRWESNGVAIWERWGGSEMTIQERWESSVVARREGLCFIQGWGMQGETKISSFCF